MMVSSMDLDGRSGKRAVLLLRVAMEIVTRSGDDVVEDWYDQIDLCRRPTGD
jgi:hypothetical protein